MKNGPYTLVIAPEDYPGKKYRGRYCYEHHLVYWKKHKKLPGRGELIHHINGDKRDNRLSNLILMTVARHNGHHAPEAEILDMECVWCGKEFSRDKRNVVFKRKRGQRNFFCSLSCGTKHQFSK